MIITLKPDQIFTKVQQVAKHPGNATHLIRRKPKRAWRREIKRSQRGDQGESGPKHTHSGHEDGKKEVFETFQLKSAETLTGERDRGTERRKALSSINDPVGYLLVKIGHLAI